MIEKCLSHGAMGIVYRAKSIESNQFVAIKIIPIANTADPLECRQRLREAKLLARIPPHPNVVRLYHAGVEQNAVQIRLELVSGGDLREQLKQPLHPNRAAEILLDLANGLAHVHQSGVYHLDIKPSNVLWDGDRETGRPKLADFGIARLTSRQSDTQTDPSRPGRGTIQYMAPEQFREQPTDLTAATDVHGLGATLYEMLTGKPPYRETRPEVFGMHSPLGPPTPPHEFNSKIPIELSLICSKALAPKPADRYPSAESLVRDLELFLQGKPVSVRPLSPFAAFRKAARRHPKSLIGAVSLVSLLLACTLSFWWFWRNSELARSTLEHNYRETAASVIQLVDATLADFDIYRSHALHKDVLESTRRRILAISDHLHTDEFRPIALLDMVLAMIHDCEDQPRRGNIMYKEAYQYFCIYLRDHPRDAEMRRYCLTTLVQLWLYELEFPQAGPNQAEEFARQASLQAREVLDSPQACLAICHLSDARRKIARDLILRNKAVEAIRLLKDDQDMHASLPEALKQDWRIRLRRNATHAWLGSRTDPAEHWLPPSALAQSSFPPGHPLRIYLCDVLVTRTGWVSLHPATAGPGSPPTLSDDQFAADLLHEALDLTSKLGAPVDLIPAAFLELHRYASVLATNSRTKGNLTRADRIARQLHALAQQVAKKFPQNHKAQLLLSEAATQIAKNKFAHNAPDAEKWLEISLNAATKSTTLDPDDLEARRILERCRSRLARTRSQPKKTQ